MPIKHRKILFFMALFVFFVIIVFISLHCFRLRTLSFFSTESSDSTVSVAEVERNLQNLNLLRRFRLIRENEFQRLSAIGYFLMRNTYFSAGDLANAFKINNKLLSDNPADMDALFSGYRLACLLGYYKEALAMSESIENVAERSDGSDGYVWSKQHLIVATALQV